MLTFYSLEDCPDCRSIEQDLAGTTLAHKVVRFASRAEARAALPEGAAPPALADDGQLYCGVTEIARHLERLRQFKAEWDKFQSDACYCDDEGNVI